MAAQSEAVTALRQEHLGAVEELRQQVHGALPGDQQRDLLDGLRQRLNACLPREQHESAAAELRHQLLGHAQALQLLQQQVGGASPVDGQRDTGLTDAGGLRQQLVAQGQALQLLQQQVGDASPLQAQRDGILPEARQHTDAALAAHMSAETQQLQVQIAALRAQEQQHEAVVAEMREAVQSLQLQVDGLASHTERDAERGEGSFIYGVSLAGQSRRSDWGSTRVQQYAQPGLQSACGTSGEGGSPSSYLEHCVKRCLWEADMHLCLHKEPS